MLGEKLEIKDMFILNEEGIETLPQGVKDCYERKHSAFADTKTMTNYYILPRRMTKWVKFLGLFSKKLMINDLSQDFVRVINEEVLHQIISKAHPRTTAYQEHAVIAELRKMDYKQYPYCDVVFSDGARAGLYKKKA